MFAYSFSDFFSGGVRGNAPDVLFILFVFFFIETFFAG